MILSLLRDKPCGHFCEDVQNRLAICVADDRMLIIFSSSDKRLKEKVYEDDQEEWRKINVKIKQLYGTFNR